MGLGSLLSGGKHLLDSGIDKAEDGLDAGKKLLGEGIEKTAHGAGDVLEHVGADGWADKVEDWGNDTASDLGASVGEQQLGETDQPDELIHGQPDKIRTTATKLTAFATAFEQVGQGMKQLDSSHWKGQAGDAFRHKAAMHPTKWLYAADACSAASKALHAYADTVAWAQGQAKEAIALYKQGKHASQDAVDTYNATVDAYNATVKAGRDPGPRPAPFSDPGKAGIEHAQHLLWAARSQRDNAAAHSDGVLKKALEHAPHEPPATDRIADFALDGMGAAQVEGTHLIGGVLKGTAGLLNFARGLNPLDVYNLTHPAEYLQHANMTLAGLVSTAAHPERIPEGLFNSIRTDPAEGIGRLLPTLVGTDGIGLAADGVKVAAEEGVVDAAGSGLVHAGESVPKDWSDLAQPAPGISEKAIHADSVPAARAQEYLDEKFPWLKDVNNTGELGYTDNCSHNVATVDKRLDGIEVSAAPKEKGGWLDPKELGITDRGPSDFDQVKSYDDLIRDMNARPEGTRSMVYIARPGGTAHVFNAVKTPDGVVFLDGQSGYLARLEWNVSHIAHMPYR